MNLENIKKIVTSNQSDPIKEDLIIQELAKDEKVIPMIISILNEERKERKQLIIDTNMNLSRADIIIEANEKLMKKKVGNSDAKFILDEIKVHYKKWSNVISHCFNKYN